MFSISTHNLPWCTTFDKAAAIWHDCSPGKGAVWGEHSRPLENSRMRHKAITKHSDRSYSFDLYQTEMVRYFPDGRVRVRRHDSPSSNKFVYRFSPAGVQYSKKGLIRVLTREGDLYVRPKNDVLEIQAGVGHDHHHLILSETEQRYRYTGDRKKARQVLVPYRPFLKWAKAAQKLTGHSVFSSRGRPHISASIPAVPTEDDYLELTQMFSSENSFRSFIFEQSDAYYMRPIPDTTKPIQGKRNKLWDST